MLSPFLVSSLQILHPIPLSFVFKMMLLYPLIHSCLTPLVSPYNGTQDQGHPLPLMSNKAATYNWVVDIVVFPMGLQSPSALQSFP